MRKTIRNVFLIALSLLLLGSFAACGVETATENGSLQVSTIKIVPTAYLDEAYDLREVILMEDGVNYSATACYIEYIFDANSKTYSRNEHTLAVDDLCFTPTVSQETVVTITATRGKETAQKVILVPTSIHADPLDELYQSSGIIGGADNGITKTINQDPQYIQGENSATSLHVEFSTVDPHAFGNTFMDLGNEHAQKIFTDQTWENAIVTFWIYNPMEKPIEFQLAIMDNTHEIMTDWNPADGPHRQFAKPGEWTQIFFSLRAMGTKHRLTNNEFSTEYLSIKMQYEDYSLDTAYTYDFYLDNLDVVPASTYPEIDTAYTMSDETLEDGWENMIMDIGWQGASTIYNYDEIMGDGSLCSLQATFPGEKGKTNSFICLSPEAVAELNGNLDMTGGKLSAYFKFENMPAAVAVDIVNKAWQVSNKEDIYLKSVGNGWYYGELDLEKLQVGTGRNDNIIRIRFHFSGIKDSSVVYMDTCKYEYKYVNKVLESPKVDLINMSPDVGSFYCNVDHAFVTTHLQGGNSVRSLKIKAHSSEKGRYTWNTQAAADNGEISAKPNMTKGTLGAWFYFGDQAPSAGFQVTSSNWMGSREIEFVFTKKGSDGWYYGELHGSDIEFFETADTKGVLRWTLIIPEGYTVYVDNLSWSANVENELIEIDTIKPDGTKFNFVAGEDQIIDLTNVDKLTSLSLDYKLESGENLGLALMPNWENYYGYFDLTNDGCDVPGTTTEKLDNGYIRVTFDFTTITKVYGTPTTVITMLYVRGEWTNASGVIENISWVVDDSVEEPTEPAEEISFTAGQDQIIELVNTNKLVSLSLDYKLESGTNLAIALMPNWENYYGYFDLTKDGCDVPGTTAEKLDDGYIRLTFQMDALSKTNGTPTTDITMLYIRGEWTDATGLIKNISWIVDDGSNDPTEPSEPTEPEDRINFVAGQDQIIEVVNTAKLASLRFDYKLESGTKLAVALMPNWENYYGYFDLTKDGCDVPGTITEKLDNGYIRVTFCFDEVTKVSGNPTSDITMLYIRGEWTDASGGICNIAMEEAAAEAPNKIVEGGSLVAGQDRTIELGNNQALTRVTFDYKVTGTFNIALMPNWENYYGYFAFNENGTVDTYDGVTFENLGNGYIRVTMDMAKLNKYSGNPSTTIDFLYVRGNWSEANGEITNICLYWNATYRSKKTTVSALAQSVRSLFANILK